METTGITFLSFSGPILLSICCQRVERCSHFPYIRRTSLVILIFPGIMKSFRNRSKFMQNSFSKKFDQVCLLDSSLSVFSALSIMAANQQLAVPVWDAHTDSYMGMLTVTDLVEIVLACRSSKSYTSCLEGLKV